MTEFQDPRTGKFYRIESLPDGLVQFIADGVPLFIAKRNEIITEFEPDECRTCMRWHSWLEMAPE